MSSSSVAGWSTRLLSELIDRKFSGPSPTCEERPIGESEEWGLLKTTAVTWSGWNENAHKVPPRQYWGNASIEVRRGDVLITKAGPRHRVGVVAHVAATRPHLMVSGKMIGLRPNTSKVVPSVLAGILSTDGVQDYLNSRTTGMAESQTNFSDEALLRTELDVPPMPEQRRIAEILDTMDGQIRATEQIIGKLKLTGDGLINDLLTCGIDGHGELRRPIDNPELFTDTPIGLLPRDWNITSVGEAFDVQSGITLGPHRRPRKGSVRYLRVANVRRAALDLTELSRLQVSVAERHRYALRENDLLVVEGHGDVGQIGRCARVDSHAVGLLHQNHLFRLRSSALNAVLAEAWLNSDYAKSYWRRTCSTSSGLNTINSRQLKAMVVGLPSYSEQERIAAFLTAQQSRMDSERKMLAGLQSLKQGLMSDLLTGRVRVPPETAS